MSSDSESLIKKSFSYFEEHREELILQYKDQVIVIYNGQVKGAYSSKMDAYHNAPQDHEIELGTFLIKLCSEAENTRHVKTYRSQRPFGE